jgi:DNA-binding LacI/PurR family transcriptional regulator
VVEQCIRELGYRPAGRRTPAPRHRAGVLGLVVPLRPGEDQLALTRFMGAMVIAARRRDHDVLLLAHDADLAALRRAMAAAAADALIVIDVQTSDRRIPALLALDRPVVLIGAPERATGLSGVDVDFGAAAEQAIEHLANLGHRSVGLIGLPLPLHARGANYPRRFTRAVEATAGRRGVRTRWRPCGDSAEAVRGCLGALFAESPDITALVVENEIVLPVVIEQLRKRGRRVPEDISMLAVCHGEAAERLPVPVTSVAVPTVELCRLAVEMALRQVDGQAGPETRLLTPVLTVRESTGPGPVASSCA